MLKILQARLQQYVNQELPEVQAGFRKGRGTRDQIANICRIIKKASESQKNIYFCFIDHTKVFLTLCESQQTVENSFFLFVFWKFLKRQEYQTTLPISWETCMQIKKQQLGPYLEQWTGSKLGKKYDKAVYCHPIYLTYMRSTSAKRQTGWSTSWNQDCPEKISTTSDMQMIPL